MAPGSLELAARTVGTDAVSAAILGAMQQFKTPHGGYRLQNEWRYLIAAT